MRRKKKTRVEYEFENPVWIFECPFYLLCFSIGRLESDSREKFALFSHLQPMETLQRRIQMLIWVILWCERS